MDLKEAQRLRNYPRYVPCAVRLLAFYLQRLREAVGTPAAHRRQRRLSLAGAQALDRGHPSHVGHGRRPLPRRLGRAPRPERHRDLQPGGGRALRRLVGDALRPRDREGRRPHAPRPRLRHRRAARDQRRPSGSAAAGAALRLRGAAARRPAGLAYRHEPSAKRSVSMPTCRIPSRRSDPDRVASPAGSPCDAGPIPALYGTPTDGQGRWRRRRDGRRRLSDHTVAADRTSRCPRSAFHPACKPCIRTGKPSRRGDDGGARRLRESGRLDMPVTGMEAEFNVVLDGVEIDPRAYWKDPTAFIDVPLLRRTRSSLAASDGRRRLLRPRRDRGRHARHRAGAGLHRAHGAEPLGADPVRARPAHEMGAAHRPPRAAQGLQRALQHLLRAQDGTSWTRTATSRSSRSCSPTSSPSRWRWSARTGARPESACGRARSASRSRRTSRPTPAS